MKLYIDKHTIVAIELYYGCFTKDYCCISMLDMDLVFIKYGYIKQATKEL